MKLKVKRIAGVVRLSITILVITLASSCYLKNGHDPAFQYYDQGKNSSLSDKDLSKFVFSVRKVDGQAEAHYKMALYFQRNRRHKLAIEELNSALQQDPTMAKAYNAMGVSYDNLRENIQAIHCYQLALKIDSNLDYVHNNLGYSYLNIGKLDAAIKSFQKAIQFNSESKRYHNNLALAYVMNDQYDLVVDQLKIFEGEPHAGKTVVKLAHRLGKKEFENQILSSLRKTISEKNQAAEAKSFPGKTGAVREQIVERGAMSISKEPLVVRREIEYPVSRAMSDKVFTRNKISPKETKAESTSISEPPNRHYQTASREKLQKQAIQSLSREARTPDITESVDESEIVAVHDRNKEDSIVSSDAKGNNIYANRHMRVRWEDAMDNSKVAQDRMDVSLVIPSDNTQHQINRIMTYKPAIRNENSKQKQEKGFGDYFEESLHLSAFEIVSEPLTEKSQSDSTDLQYSDDKAPISAIKKKTVESIQPGIKPKVIDVDDIIKALENRSENTMPVEAAGRLKITEQSDRKRTTQKKVPFYAASELPLKMTKNKGPSIIMVSPFKKKYLHAKAATSTTDIKTERMGKDTVELEIANGNGVNGMAKELRYFLAEKGYEVVKITNANTFEHLTTKIFYYRGQRTDVESLIKEIAFSPDEGSIIELKSTGRRIKIIIGKDIIKHYQMLGMPKFIKNRSLAKPSDRTRDKISVRL